MGAMPTTPPTTEMPTVPPMPTTEMPTTAKPKQGCEDDPDVDLCDGSGPKPTPKPTAPPTTAEPIDEEETTVVTTTITTTFAVITTVAEEESSVDASKAGRTSAYIAIGLVAAAGATAN